MLTNRDGFRIISKYETATTLPVPDAERLVTSLVHVPLNENQFSALVSFMTCRGFAAFDRSKLLQYVNAGQPFKAAAEFSRWTWSGGKRRTKLIRRRNAEKKLFLRPVIVVNLK